MIRFTEKQQKFVEFYVEGNSGAVSARRAGYGKGAAVRASNLLKKPEIRQAIREQQLAIRLETGLGKGDLVRASMRSYETAQNVEDQLRAIDRIAKLCGYYS